MCHMIYVLINGTVDSIRGIFEYKTCRMTTTINALNRLIINLHLSSSESQNTSKFIRAVPVCKKKEIIMLIINN